MKKESQNYEESLRSITLHNLLKLASDFVGSARLNAFKKSAVRTLRFSDLAAAIVAGVLAPGGPLSRDSRLISRWRSKTKCGVY